MDDFLIMNKSVDKSVLKQGFAIPNKLSDYFYDRLGFKILPGEKKPVTLMLDGVEYKAIFTNEGYNRDKFSNHVDNLQIRYTEKSPIAYALRAKFSATNELAMQQQGEENRRKHLVVPEGQREYLAIYTDDIPGKFKLDCLTTTVFREAALEINKLDEWAMETETAIDPDASLVTTIGAQKVRHISRAIGDNLKHLYGYRCQICGQYIGERYGSTLIHAHHIDYFVKSLNNDASNLLVVCPNHHSIIHDRNPVFDKKKLIYTYPNGYSEGLILNENL